MNAREIFFVFLVHATGRCCRPISCWSSADVGDIVLVLVIYQIFIVVAAHDFQVFNEIKRKLKMEVKNKSDTLTEVDWLPFHSQTKAARTFLRFK